MSRPLWMSEDNKQFHEGDVAFSIENKEPASRLIREEYGFPPVQQWSSMNKYFYTKEARDKYLLDHHKGLSVDQVIKALGLKKNDKRINNLKEIIKSDLKC